MPTTLADLNVDELRTLIQDTVRHTLEDYLEDLEALRSESFAGSIAEAREDYRKGKTTPLAELLGEGMASL